MQITEPAKLCQRVLEIYFNERWQKLEMGQPTRGLPIALSCLTLNRTAKSLKFQLVEATSVSDRNPASSPARPNVLFLCTGNYYRSRFAEELFNHLAAAQHSPWTATSRGFTPHPHTNPGTISIHTLRALELRKIQPANPHRMPAAVQIDDFQNHPHCIALSEIEHRPMMARMFPQFLSHVRFWKIEDLAWETPESAIARIECEVKNLLQELR